MRYARRPHRLQRARTRAREMPLFGQELFVRAAAEGAARPTRPTARRSPPAGASPATRASTRSWPRIALDALVAPTGGPAWLTDLVNGDHFTGGSSHPGGGGRLPAHHRARGLRLRPAGRAHLLRPRRAEDDARSASPSPSSRPPTIAARRPWPPPWTTARHSETARVHRSAPTDCHCRARVIVNSAAAAEGGKSACRGGRRRLRCYDSDASHSHA